MRTHISAEVIDLGTIAPEDGEVRTLIKHEVAPPAAPAGRRRPHHTDVAIGCDRACPVVRLGAHLRHSADDQDLSPLTVALDFYVSFAGQWSRWEIQDLGGRPYVTLTLRIDDLDLDAAAALGAAAQRHFERAVAPFAIGPTRRSGHRAALERSYLAAFAAVLADAD